MQNAIPKAQTAQNDKTCIVFAYFQIMQILDLYKYNLIGFSFLKKIKNILFSLDQSSASSYMIDWFIHINFII